MALVPAGMETPSGQDDARKKHDERRIRKKDEILAAPFGRLLGDRRRLSSRFSSFLRRRKQR